MEYIPPTIMSRNDADKAVPGHFKAVISISDPETAAPYRIRRCNLPKLILHFDDVEQEGQERFGYQRATEHDVSRIIQFAKMWNGPLLVHCLAGISRSSATALIVDAIHRNTEEDVLRILNPMLHWPNEWLLELADIQLGTSLRPKVAEWKKSVKLFPDEGE